MLLTQASCCVALCTLQELPHRYPLRIFNAFTDLQLAPLSSTQQAQATMQVLLDRQQEMGTLHQQPSCRHGAS
jgi:hypothetical protein